MARRQCCPADGSSGSSAGGRRARGHGLAPGSASARRSAGRSRARLLPVDRGQQQHRATRQRPESGAVRRAPGNFGFVNSDLAFSGSTRSSAASTASRSTTCPTRPTRSCAGRSSARAGRVTLGVRRPAVHVGRGDPRPHRLRHPGRRPATVNPERFRGVRIFDISDIDNPVQLPGVQTCRGSHTHTLVTDPDDPANIYIYNSGTAGVRSPLELAGCENASSDNPAPVDDAATRPSGASTSSRCRWRTRRTAAIVSQPRIFTDPAPVRSTACRTPSPARCTRRAPRTARCRTPTPATTSRPTRSSGWRPAPARATASCSTSPTR